MNKFWIDPDLLDNRSGIGRDSRLMMEWLEVNFECEIVEWPRPLNLEPRIRRKFLLGLRLLFGNSINLPNSYSGAFYQSQLGPLLPGRQISVWIVRLHDLFPTTNPEWFRWWATKIFKKSLTLAVNRNAIFLCDSASTETEVKRLFKNTTLHTYVIPCRLPQVTGTNCGSCDGCKGLKTAEEKQYFLSVGTVEPRKNYELALSTWSDLRSHSESAPNLIIVGRQGWKTKKTQKALLRATNQGVIWFTNCCDGALENLYAQAEGIISFSLAEGFDLPPMEARQRYQKPLILSDIPVHREFHDGSAEFFSTKLELLEILKKPLIQSTISKYSELSVSTLNVAAACIKSML